MKYVVGIVYNKENVLLISKKRPTWQAGMLNGIGGKIEPGENPLQAMIRECKEECNLDIENWESGTAFPEIRDLRDMALLFKTSVEELRGDYPLRAYPRTGHFFVNCVFNYLFVLSKHIGLNWISIYWWCF